MLKKMLYLDSEFDRVLAIITLEHLKPAELESVFAEIKRILKPGRQLVNSCPIEQPFMVFMFWLLGYDIRDHHFSTERDIETAASHHSDKLKVQTMSSTPTLFGNEYEIGHFIKG